MTGLRVAVLGGTGWLGRHVCACLADRGHDVVVVARRPAPHTAAFRFAAMDLAAASAAEIGSLLRAERIGVVVNATDAANATDGWERTEAELAATNQALVNRMLEGISSLPWRSRLVHIGTMLEYGDVPAGRVIGEDTEPSPATPYTRTKLAGSEAVLAAARAGVVDGLVLRSANITGPFPSPASFPGKLLALLRSSAATGLPLKVTVTGSTRDYVDVRDVAEAVARAAEAACTGRAVNIGSGEAVDAPTLVRTLVAVAGFPQDRLQLDHRDLDSLGGAWMRADIGLAADLLGWAPRICLRDSLLAMWRTPKE